MKIEIKNPDSFFVEGKPEEIIAIEQATGVRLHKQSNTLWADYQNDVWLSLDVNEEDKWFLYLGQRGEPMSDNSKERYARLAMFCQFGTHSTPPMSA